MLDGVADASQQKPRTPPSVIAARSLLGCQGCAIAVNVVLLSFSVSFLFVALGGFARTRHGAGGAETSSPLTNPASLVLDAVGVGFVVLFGALVALTFVRRRWALVAAGSSEVVCIGLLTYVLIDSAATTAKATRDTFPMAEAALLLTLIAVGVLTLALLLSAPARGFFEFNSSEHNGSAVRRQD